MLLISDSLLNAVFVPVEKAIYFFIKQKGPPVPSLFNVFQSLDPLNMKKSH